MITILAAVDSNWGLAKYGKIPWHLPEDMKRFKELTLGHTVLMGYGTWLSLPMKPLKLRKNIVLSRNHHEDSINDDGPFFHSSLPNIGQINNLFVIGGKQIYKHFLKERLVDKCIITQLYDNYKCDLLFPLELLDDMKLSSVSIETEFKTLIYVNKE